MSTVSSSITTTPQSAPHHILHFLDGGQLAVAPEDEDRFVVPSKHAVCACQGLAAVGHFFSKFRNEFIPKIQEWCKQNKDRVQACYVLPLTTEALRVFVVAKSMTFDFALSDLIASLELELFASDWECDILQLPPSHRDALRSFFNPDESMQVFDDGDEVRAFVEG